MTSIRDWTLEQLKAGTAASFEHTITEAELDAFAALSGDRNPLHCDPAYGRAFGFPDRFAHGVLLGADPVRRSAAGLRHHPLSVRCRCHRSSGDGPDDHDRPV